METLTGALGLMTTLGARGCPSLLGVPEPAAPALLPAPTELAEPCGPKSPPAFVEADAPGWPGCGGTGPPGAPSTGDWILLRASASWVCDDDGVGWAELEGELEAPREGEAVPEESFFLDDLLSLARESCSC